MPTKKPKNKKTVSDVFPEYRVSSKNIKDNLKHLRRKASGLWGHAILMETTEGTAMYPISWDLTRWCHSRDFPIPKNEEEEKRILELFDYRLYVLKVNIKILVNDFLDMLIADRAIIFYLGLAIGGIIGFSIYHYFF